MGCLIPRSTSPARDAWSPLTASLAECIRWAYNVKEYQVIGPDWLNHSADAGFDIEAKAPASTPEKEIRLMLQTLLAERLKLVLHREERMLPVYTLAVANGGAKLKAAAPKGRRSTSSMGGTMTATSVSMEEFAYQLSRELKLPVFDKTGLPGAFDFTLDYAPNDDGGGRPGLLTAIQEQLGLKLQSGKGPVEVLVIDHAEKVPSAN